MPNADEPSQPTEAPPLAYIVESFIRAYPHVLIFAAIALYFIFQRLNRWYQDYQDRKPINGPAKKATDDGLTMEERIALARERQQRLADEASARDAAYRAEQERKHLELEKQRKAMREGKEFDERGKGRKLGTGEEEDDNGGVRKLPKLPGGDRDTYEPFPSASNDAGGARYRPTGFQRPKRGG